MVKLLKKWREFSEGGNGYGFFLQKGKHPHRAEQSRIKSRAERTEGRKEGRKEAIRKKEEEEGLHKIMPEEAGRRRRRKEGIIFGRRKEAHAKNSKAPHPHIYFPLEIISIACYRPN